MLELRSSQSSEPNEGLSQQTSMATERDVSMKEDKMAALKVIDTLLPGEL